MKRILFGILAVLVGVGCVSSSGPATAQERERFVVETDEFVSISYGERVLVIRDTAKSICYSVFSGSSKAASLGIVECKK